MLKDWRNKLLFGSFNAIQPVYRMIFPSDVAYIYCARHVLTPFVIMLKLKLNITVHILHPGADFSSYRKVIIPNGMWPTVRAATERIPREKRVYCEVGFFPQNRNVYFDDKEQPLLHINRLKGNFPAGFIGLNSGAGVQVSFVTHCAARSSPCAPPPCRASWRHADAARRSRASRSACSRTSASASRRH